MCGERPGFVDSPQRMAAPLSFVDCFIVSCVEWVNWSVKLDVFSLAGPLRHNIVHVCVCSSLSKSQYREIVFHHPKSKELIVWPLNSISHNSISHTIQFNGYQLCYEFTRKHWYHTVTFTCNLMPCFAVLCSVVFMLWSLVDSSALFTLVLQGYFTGTGAIVWLPQCRWSNPEGQG